MNSYCPELDYKRRRFHRHWLPRVLFHYTRGYSHLTPAGVEYKQTKSFIIVMPVVELVETPDQIWIGC